MQQRTHSGCLPSQHIGRIVPHEDGSGQIKIKFALSLKKHPRSGFAEFAIATIMTNAMLWMVRAVVNGVDFAALLNNLLANPIHQLMKVGFGIIAPPNACLIGYDYNQITIFLGRGNEFEYPVNEIKILRFMHIPMVDIDDAISVQKKRALFHT